MKRCHTVLLAAAALLTACEKNININYHSIEPLYVVEGIVNEQLTTVKVTKTRDMGSIEESETIDGLIVRLTDDVGNSELLRFSGVNYLSEAHAKGVPGTTYTLSISDGEDEFVSTSKMHTPGKLGSISYIYRPDLSEKHLLCTVSVLDKEAGDNYYQLRLNKNSRNTLRQTFTDKGRDGGTISILIPVRFSFEPLPEPAEGEEQVEDHIFRKGDLLEMELRTIDRPAYDYIYSLELSGNISFNPSDNFTGDCLGYFTAYSSDSYSTVFDPDDLPGMERP